MRILITSRSGAGKSAVCQELKKRGLPAFDGDDVEGLARWVDTTTGQPIRMDYSNPIIDRDKYHWDWDVSVLNALLSKHSDMFLCGSADNQLPLHNLFDKVFVLALDPEVQRQRLISRTSHGYAKHPAMQAQVLAEQQEFIAQALQSGAIAIDANSDVATVTDSILEHCQNDR